MLYSPPTERLLRETSMPRRRSTFAAIALLAWMSIAMRAAWAQEELFVANTAANSILVYSRVATGDSAPIRTISGAATGLNGPSTVVVDQDNGELLVANQGNNSITVYSLKAGGNAAPIRTLSGAATGLSGPQFLALTTRAIHATFPSNVGFYRPSNSTFFLYFQNHIGLVSGAGIPFGGFDIDLPVIGDWDANSVSTIGVYRPSANVFYLRNSNSIGPVDITAVLGAPGDLPVVGDFAANGTTTVGVYRPSNSTFYLSYDNVSVARRRTLWRTGRPPSGRRLGRELHHHDRRLSPQHQHVLPAQQQ